MSEIIQLYKDREKTTKIYPKTVASEVYVDENTTVVNKFEEVNEQLEQKASKEEISKGQKIARHTDGVYDNGAVLTVIGNNDNPVAQVCGFKNGQEASKYENRDSVGFYLQVDSDNPITVANGVTYTSNSVSFNDVLDYSLVKETMMIDTMHSPNRYTAFIERIDEENKTIYIKDGWWKVVQGTGSTTPELPPNGIGFYINLKTKIWGQNLNVVLRDGDKTKVGVAEEIGLFNRNTTGGELGGIDLIAFLGYCTYGFRARKKDGTFQYGFRSEDLPISFSSTSTDKNNALIRSSLNGNYERDGYEVLADGKANKLKLYTYPITNGVTSITDYKRKVWLINKSIIEEVSIPSAESLDGEVIFLNNNGSETVTFRPTSGSVLLNGVIRGTFPMIPNTQAILISDGVNWRVNCLNNMLPVFATSNRPSGNLANGTIIIDDTLKKPIWRDGSVWKDFNGTQV